MAECNLTIVKTITTEQPIEVLPDGHVRVVADSTFDVLDIGDVSLYCSEHGLITNDLAEHGLSEFWEEL